MIVMVRRIMPLVYSDDISVVPVTGKDDAANCLAYRQCGVHGIGYGNWNHSAAEQELYPHLIEAVATCAVRRVYDDPLGDANGLHTMT